MPVPLLQILFWAALIAVFYAYLGYGILLYILLKTREENAPPAPLWPQYCQK